MTLGTAVGAILLRPGHAHHHDLRTMLPAPDFTQAAPGVPEPADGATPLQLAEQAADHMGAYYPVGVYCTKAQFEAHGPLSCF